MDQQLFQTLTALFSLLITIIGVLAGMWVRGLQRTLESHQQQFLEMQRQITSLNVLLAGNYAPRAELQTTFDRIFALLQEIQREVRHS